ncbi:MAG: ion channel, partial [Saprospiraceae bacterium]
AADYFVLYKIYPDIFRGILATDDLSAAAEMLYFSLVTFTTTGFGDIVPTSNLARLPVSPEVIVGFASTIFVISNFSNFKAQRNDS